MKAGLLFAALLLSACNEFIPFPTSLDAPIHVTVLGSSSRNCTFAPASAQHRELSEWLAKNRTGWSQIYYTPPEVGILVSAPGLHLHFHGTTVYATGPEGILSKDVSESEYAYLRCPAGA